MFANVDITLPRVDVSFWDNLYKTRKIRDKEFHTIKK